MIDAVCTGSAEITLGHIRSYIKNELQQEIKKTQEIAELTTNYRKDTEKLKKKLEELKTGVTQIQGYLPPSFLVSQVIFLFFLKELDVRPVITPLNYPQFTFCAVIVFISTVFKAFLMILLNVPRVSQKIKICWLYWKPGITNNTLTKDIQLKYANFKGAQ